ncbi:MAG: RHS repeat-associated core domain-containing protein, partial [Bacteroidota bacterium]
MKRSLSRIILFLLIIFRSASLTYAQSGNWQAVYINFGLNNQAASPWNNTLSVPAQNVSFSDLLDDSGVNSGIDLVITSNWSGTYDPVFDDGAVTGNDSGVYPDAVIEEYYYFGTFGVPDIMTMELRGLDPSGSYDITFLGSSVWSGVPDNGSTVYTINGQSATLNVQANNSETVTLSDLSPDNAGVLQIEMSKAVGTPVGYINALVVTPSSGSPILPPISPSQLALLYLDEAIVQISWADNSMNETGFIIERSNNPTTGFVEVGTTSLDVNTFHEEGLASATTYYYRVAAQNGLGTSDYSEVFEVTTSQFVTANIDFTHHARYNGSITAIKWKNFGDAEEKLFTYHYDHANRLTAAQFAQGTTDPANSWTASLAGGFSVPQINYDPNGNINSLNRQELNSSAQTIDALTYAYSGNRLMAVTDLTGWSGFADKNDSGNDYDYDDNGNLISDENQGISSIVYNHMDLPERINKTTGDYILYVYDASGTKLSEELYSPTDELIKRTDYMGEFVFENDELKLVHHEEGRVVPDQTDGGFEYHYDLRDHLGNSRVTFSNKTKTLEFKINFENDPALPDDITLFEGTDPISSSEFMDHTDELENTGADLYSNSQLLNAGEGYRLGSAIALPVMQGDMVTAEVFAKYIDPETTTSVGTVPALGTTLIGAFMGARSLTTEMGSSINNNFTGDNGSLIGTTGFEYEDANAPKAFLNVMFLPEDEVVTLDQTSFAFDQIAATAEQPTGVGAMNAPFDHLMVQDFQAPAKGYIIVYLSNENDTHVDVHFDDVLITLNQKELVQSQDYYPFGLTFNDYKRTGLDKNEYLYQGKEEMEGTDWYDFHARSYHAGLGRFMQIDPRLNGPSGYVGMLNNPISTIDPDGEEPITLTAIAVAAAIGAGTSAVAYTASIALSDGGFNNWDWGQFGKGVAIGSVSGAVTFGIGTGFNNAATAAVEAGKASKVAIIEVSRIATHATFQGGLSAAQGGDFWTAFASGAIGGGVGLGTDGWESNFGRNATTIGSAMLLGGVTSDLAGGDFWEGAAISGIVAGANGVAHKIGQNILQQRAENRGPLGKKVDINKLSYDELLSKLREVHQYMDNTGEKLYFEDVFKPKSFDTPSTMRVIGMSTRTKTFRPNDIRIGVSLS